ncbi:MAG: DegT/DnrJ/EryC1/StrS family aminotransferase [Candidatus Micrarchaeota archaeon]
MIPIAKPVMQDEEINAVIEVMKSGQIAHGPVVEEFERKCAEYSGYKHGIACTNGTTALHLAMLGAEIKPGDEVIIPDFTFIATANTPRFVGAVPVFADVDKKTFNIDPEDVKRKITPKTKAIIGVSLYGQAYDMDALKEIAESKGIPLISDNAQAIGCEWNGKKNLGDYCATLSFYPTKNMTTGEGGMVLTDDDALAEKILLYRTHGQRKQYDYATMGFNFRMTSLCAAIGLAQLKKIDAFTERRRKNAALLNELLDGVVETPFVDSRAKHVYHQYTIKTDKRDELKEHLKNAGVGSGVYYPQPLHELPTFDAAHANCPNTIELTKRVLSLPVHPLVTEQDVETIAQSIKSFNG